ncbi:MAG: hypothetical protein LBB77_00785, partial [Treponema sp.]|nr:hypothetical protein [Treponema sp.]
REGLKDGVGMLRTLYVVYVIPDIHNIFGLFSLVPQFAKDNVSGLDIVTNPTLVEKYFVQSLDSPYEDFLFSAWLDL